MDKIVTPRRPKVDGEGVTVNEVRHVVSLVDVPAIAHNLSALFGGARPLSDTTVSRSTVWATSAWRAVDEGE